MTHLMKEFLECTKEKCNSLGVLMCLAVNTSDATKAIFTASKVFLFYFLPNTVELLLPINTE